MNTLSTILDKIFSDPELRSHYVEARILTLYPQTVGEKIASISYPKSFSQGILVVKVSSAPWRNELNLMTLQIRDALNTELGEYLIKKIIFR
ncbi:MAG: DUF721 domain-containing protein [Calditrichaeota bacterium]|nr:MAG: DUF721 domain-containing protein [Calditrichota bacterium]